MKAAWRRLLFNLHLWTGLGAGAFLLVAALTGSVLAYRTELDAAGHPGWFRVADSPTRVTMDAVVASARLIHSKVEVDEVSLHPDPTSSILVQFIDRFQVYVDPHTGRVLGSRDKDRSFVYIVEKLHRYLFVGKKGQWITGSASLALVVMVLTGLYLWLPRSWKGFKGSFAFNRRLRGRAWNVNLHKTVGAYAALMLLLAALTGAPDAADWVIKTYGHHAKKAAKAQRTLAPSTPAPFEDLWQRARATVPDYQFARIGWPSEPGRPFMFEMMEAKASHDNAISTVYLDQTTGAVVRYEPYAMAPLATRLYDWCLPLHLGHFWGPVGQLLVVAGSLALAFLVVTGGWLYYRRALRPIQRSSLK